MEQKKITYTGIDTDDVTRLLEAGNDKQAEKGWREFRVDMLSSSTVRVTYVRGSWTRRTTASPRGSDPPPGPERRQGMVIGLIVGILFCAGVLYFQHRNKDKDEDS